jgi:hypothetical protein
MVKTALALPLTLTISSTDMIFDVATVLNRIADCKFVVKIFLHNEG